MNGLLLVASFFMEIAGLLVSRVTLPRRVDLPRTASGCVPSIFRESISPGGSCLRENEQEVMEGWLGTVRQPLGVSSSSEGKARKYCKLTLCCAFSGRDADVDKAQPEARPSSHMRALQEGLRLIWSSGYLIHLCSYLLMHSFISSMFYFTKTLVVARSRMGSSSRTAWFASINSASAFLIFVLQVFATRS